MLLCPCCSLQAYELYLEGRQYIVRDNEVVLIDESTGRLRPITRWQGGLHQVRGGWGGSEGRLCPIISRALAPGEGRLLSGCPLPCTILSG